MYKAIAWFVVMIVAVQASGSTVTIEFGTSTAHLPYTEDDTLVETLSGGGIVVSNNSDGYLVSGTNFTPIRWRVSRAEAFDLISLDVERYARTWRIESPTGAVVDVIEEGTIDFSGITGWQHIPYFEIVHDPGEPNGFAEVDNIVLGLRLPGDLDGNGFVSLGDLDLVLDQWNQNVTPGDLLAGDPTGDGFVGLDDLDTVLNNWNAGTPPATTIPEPAGALLLLAGSSALFHRRV